MSDETPEFTLQQRVITVVALGGVIAAILMFGGNKDEGNQEGQQVYTEVLGSDEIVEVEPNLGNYDPDAAFEVYEARLSELTERLARLEEDLKDSREEQTDALADSQRTILVEIERLSDRLRAQYESDVTGDYSSTVDPDDGFDVVIPDFDGPTDDNEAPFTPEAPRPFRSPFDENSIDLRTSKARDFGLYPTGTDQEGINLLDGLDGERIADGFSDVADRLNQSAGRGSADEDDPSVDGSTRSLKTILIPPGSFVDIVPLHGIECPIGGSLAGSPTNIPARPVTFIVEGVFKGPNNMTRDLGRIHLYGLCSGVEKGGGRFGRAEVRMQQFSYWDERGAQHDKVTGYVQDRRDTHAGIKGEIQRSSNSALAQASFAAALQVAAATVAAEETEMVRTEQDNELSILSGDAGRATAASGVSALFNEIGRKYAAQAEQAVDTVIIPQGIPLRFYLDVPLEVTVQGDDFEDYYRGQATNVLI